MSAKEGKDETRSVQAAGLTSIGSLLQACRLQLHNMISTTPTPETQYGGISFMPSDVHWVVKTGDCHSHDVQDG